MNRLLVSIGILFVIALPAPSHAQDDAAGLPDEITLESAAGKVVVPHDVHVKKARLKCVSCHHQVRAKALDTPHPDYVGSSSANCPVCHQPDTEGRKKYYKCSECHHSEPENIADETLSSKVVIHKSCWTCHEAGTGVEASKGCSDCHLEGDERKKASEE